MNETLAMDNDSDEDEWYRQMEAAAPVEWDTEEPQVTTKYSSHGATKAEQQLISEDEYFGNIQHYYEKEENAMDFLPEQSLIWQQWARELQAEASFDETKLSSFSPLIQLLETENSSGMMLIEQFLFSHLPLSSRIYRALRLKEPSSESLSPDGCSENNPRIIDGVVSDVPTASSYQQLVFVDDILHPSLVVLVSQPGGCCDEAALFCSTMLSSIEAHLLTAVCKLLVWSNSTSPSIPSIAENRQQRSNDIHLGAVDSCAVQAITDELHTMGYHEKSHTTASLYVLNDPHRLSLQVTSSRGVAATAGGGGGGSSLVDYDDLSQRLLPKGYAFSRLQSEDAMLIDSSSCWHHHRDSTSRPHIRSLIAEYPCLGIRYTYTNDDHTDDTNTNSNVDENDHHKSSLPQTHPTNQSSSSSLVCWCLTYDYGALGMLHTLQTHRGRGLARHLVSVLVEEWLRFDFGCAPFTYVTDNNEAAQRLFQTLGFDKMTTSVSWVDYARYYMVTNSCKQALLHLLHNEWVLSTTRFITGRVIIGFIYFLRSYCKEEQNR